MIIESIAFSGIMIALLCIFMVFSKNKKTSSDKYLVVWMIVSCFNLLYYLFSSEFPAWLQILGFTSPVLSIGMLYLYIISITFTIDFKIKYIVKHALLYIFYTVLLYCISDFYLQINFKNSIPYFSKQENKVLLNVLTFPMAIIPVIYIVLCFLALRKYQKILPEYYSALEKISLNWLQYILASLIFLFVIVLAMISFRNDIFNVISVKIFVIVAAVQSLYLFCIVFFSLRQSIIYHPVVLEKRVKVTEKKTIQSEEFSEISQKLLVFMQENKPYLDEELSLQKLSSLMNISTHQLSQIINQNLNTNFYKFINSYRIEEVKTKLSNPDFSKYSILGIAFESGFNSKSTFNKIFKEETGKTPSEYKKSV